jgi:hypothetical protein
MSDFSENPSATALAGSSAIRRRKILRTLFGGSAAALAGAFFGAARTEQVSAQGDPILAGFVRPMQGRSLSDAFGNGEATTVTSEALPGRADRIRAVIVNESDVAMRVGVRSGDWNGGSNPVSPTAGFWLAPRGGSVTFTTNLAIDICTTSGTGSWSALDTTNA